MFTYCKESREYGWEGLWRRLPYLFIIPEHLMQNAGSLCEWSQKVGINTKQCVWRRNVSHECILECRWRRWVGGTLQWLSAAYWYPPTQTCGLTPLRCTKAFCFVATYSICVQANGHYSLLADSRYTRKIYNATAIKNRRVITWKVIMTVETTGLSGSGRW